MPATGLMRETSDLNIMSLVCFSSVFRAYVDVYLHPATMEMLLKMTNSIPTGNGHLKPSRPKIVTARPKKCTSQVHEALHF